MAPHAAVERRILRIRGIVQGVGFRPFVYRTARELGLSGTVRNDPDGVLVDAEGEAGALAELARRIQHQPPPRASVEAVEVSAAPPSGRSGFEILESEALAPGAARVSPDLATCAACLAELADPGDRRFGYPFLNCTDCGPRYSIARDVPYDRSRTTMARFAMCPACAGEYADPASRRFHAQPNACPACGPRLSTAEAASGERPLAVAVRALAQGAVLALKGLGGFHLACDARAPAAVRRLRERKRRPHKPFAVMFRDLAQLEGAAHVSAAERAALLGPRRPIVLLAAREANGLAPEIAPGLRELGAFLPYTPLHQCLLQEFGGPLVMTSGNRSEEPIAAHDQEALERLRGIADCFLLHDREIHMRSDDSLVRLWRGEERLLRRARGQVPEAIELGAEGPPLLAVGADLKNALCLARAGSAVLSQHIGDLESYEAQRFFEEVRRNLERLFGVEPQLVVHDLHPGYHSSHRSAQRPARARGAAPPRSPRGVPGRQRDPRARDRRRVGRHRLRRRRHAVGRRPAGG